MAKDFSQYDDSNPVMKTLLEAKEEQKKQNSDANEILKPSENDSIVVPEKTENETKAASEPAAVIEPKKILMNISIRETTKKDWKMFFLEHDLSMTQGIETAVEYLKSEVEKGNIRLSKGGITK